MYFKTPLVKGKLIKRYKRFLADVELENGVVVVAHCTNSGSMKSCIEQGADVYLSPASDPKRKTRYTWEMIWINNSWVGVNTGWPNVLAYEAIKKNIIPQLMGYSLVKREVTFADSRFDIYCEKPGEQCFVEVKNVSMKEGEYALFPDAVTTRGQKHLKTLVDVKRKGMRAVMLYIVQRTDVSIFSPADKIDPDYANILGYAQSKGVEILVFQASVLPQKIELLKQLPVELNDIS